MAMFYIKLSSLKDFPIEEGPISPNGQFKQNLDSFYVTDSPLSVTNIAEMATGQFKRSLNSFYVTDSPLSVTNIAEMSMFYIKLTSLNDFPLEEGPISPNGQFKQSLDSFYVTDT